MKIAMYDLEGHLLEVFENIDNISQFEKDMGYKDMQIYHCINNEQLHANNRQFKKYTNGAIVHKKIGNISNINGHGSKTVHKFYKGKYVCSYKSLMEASSINNINLSAISNCCTKKSKTAGGFEWEYAN
jgi:hypothetical protein